MILETDEIIEGMKKRKLILYIATSLDGYIAQPNDDLSFLNSVQKKGENYGYSDFISDIDTIIMGRRTYDWVMKQTEVFPHADKSVYIVSRTRKGQQGNIHFYNGNLADLVNQKILK